MAKHTGRTRSDVYKCWRAMLSRCEDPTHKSFKYYGGRGVVVCERWHTLEHFQPDVGPRVLSIESHRRGQVKLTEAELEREHVYRMEERLGILCGDDQPTDEQLKIARDEADKAIDDLRNQDERENPGENHASRQ